MGQGLTVVNLAFFVLFLEKLHIPHSLILFDNGGAVNLREAKSSFIYGCSMPDARRLLVMIY